MYLLNPDRYDIVRRPLGDVSSNNLFARSVVERHVSGTIYVDYVEDPRTFYIAHPYGMTLLLGETNNDDFNTAFYEHALNKRNTRKSHEWMQVYPEVWYKKMPEIFGDYLVKHGDNTGGKSRDIIEQNTRVNFNFNWDTYRELRTSIDFDDKEILRMNKQMYADMDGSVVPKHFWNNAEEFDRYGIAFSLIYGNQIVSTAFSSYVHENQLELGIETIPACRGSGFAVDTCCTIIDYCLEHKYEPVWSCRYENIGSYKLAQKLGFEPTFYLPYYRLSD